MSETLRTLEAVIRERIADADVAASYTARLTAQGLNRVAQKIGEEGVEVALAAVTGEDAALVGECADLTYHMLVLLQLRGLDFGAVERELMARHRK